MIMNILYYVIVGTWYVSLCLESSKANDNLNKEFGLFHIKLTSDDFNLL